MRAAEPGVYYHDEVELNRLGYSLVTDGQLPAAIEIFRLITIAFPLSANAHDSLGEAYRTQGDREAAIRSYRRSLELNPRSRGGHQALAELEAER